MKEILKRLIKDYMPTGIILAGVWSEVLNDSSGQSGGIRRVGAGVVL